MGNRRSVGRILDLYRQFLFKQIRELPLVPRIVPDHPIQLAFGAGQLLPEDVSLQRNQGNRVLANLL